MSKLPAVPWRKKDLDDLDRAQRQWLHEDWLASGLSKDLYCSYRGLALRKFREFIARRERMFLARDKFSARKQACQEWLEQLDLATNSPKVSA